MSIVLLLSTTALSIGFFWLIGMATVGYIPLAILLAIIAYGIWMLYRDSDERSGQLLPYLQQQSLRRLLAIAIMRGLHYRGGTSRSLITLLALTIYAAMIIGGITTDKQSIRQQGASGYLLAVWGALIVSIGWSEIIPQERITWTLMIHRIIGMIITFYRQKKNELRTDQLYSYLTYLCYGVIIALAYYVLPDILAALIVVIVLGYILVTLPSQSIDVTPDERIITAEDILDGHTVYDTPRIQQQHIQPRQRIIGVQPQHGTLLIWCIIGVFIASIISHMSTRYTDGITLPLSDILGFVILSILAITVFVLYYLSHRHDGTISLWKIAVIIISNIAVGVSIVHLFYPHTLAIIIGSIVRNTLNNIAIRRLYHSQYRESLHPREYYYRMVANIIITIINSILIITRFGFSSSQTTIITLLGYRGIQGLLLYHIYQYYQTSPETRTLWE